MTTQDEVVAFLETLDDGPTHIATTHISIVVIGRSRAFKLKRAVRFPYLDFSTPERRLAFCEREVALNRRTAPELYLGVRRIARAPDRSLVFDGDGPLVDAVVEMRRFDEAELLDQLAAAGRLTAPMMERLAERIAAFHDAAETDAAAGGAAAMARVVDLSEASLRQTPPASGPEIDALIGRLRDSLSALGGLLDARRAQGKVRRCHGDLTLRNICLLDGAPTPFDCIEFSDEIATIDVLYDLAFLLMDLAHAGAPELANLALNRYLDRRDETDGLPLLPFFQASRAAIRAYVGAAQAKPEEARAYFDLAGRLLTPGVALVVAIGGYSGSGKSSVAARLAPRLRPAPGARILNSDRLRKRLFGAAPTDRLPQAAYAPEVSQRVYGEMFAAAQRTAGRGWPVIVDAVLDRPQDREALERLAWEAGVPFLGFWLDADVESRAARVDARVNDVSDATRAVVLAQMARDPGEIGWTRIDARSTEEAASVIAKNLAAQGISTAAP